jgi:4-hydroxy-tetrahydrodipicolinate synthase
MPASQSTDVHVAIWNKLEAGDFDGARALFNRLLPLINYERLYGVAVYKQVLYQRGVFATTVSRAPGQQLDADDRAELSAILKDVSTLFSL